MIKEYQECLGYAVFHLHVSIAPSTFFINPPLLFHSKGGYLRGTRGPGVGWILICALDELGKAAHRKNFAIDELGKAFPRTGRR